MSSTTSPIRSESQWTFTQGLILGQASFLVLTLLFVRYVVFSPAARADAEAWKKRREERTKKALLSDSKVPPPTLAALIAKANYDMATHPAESTDWLNVLFAQVMQGYRNDLVSNGGEEGARVKVERWLNPNNGAMSWLDPISVTAISLGTAYPLFSNARIRPADGRGHLRAEIDMDYSDSLSLSLSTSVLINFPRPRFAVLPVALGVELASIGGTLSVQIHDPVDGNQHLHVCLLPDFHLDLRTTSLLGSRAKLQDIPKLEQLLLSRIRSLIQDRFVHPKTISLSLPRLTVGESPMSSKEFIAELGEEAKEVMGQAVRQGLGQIVSDLGLGGDLLSPGGLGMDPAGTRSTSMRPSTRSSSVSGLPAQTAQGLAAAVPTGISVDTSASSVRANGAAGPSQIPRTRAPSVGDSPTSPISPRIGRKIHMPAGFPYSSNATPSTSDEPTPLQTPGQLGRNPYPIRQAQSAAAPPNTSASTSSFRPPVQGMNPPAASVSAQRHTPSAYGAVDPPGSAANGLSAHVNGVHAREADGGAPETSSFRFRGQFASQPPTPGMGSGLDPGGAAGRRVGVLNSRA